MNKGYHENLVLFNGILARREIPAQENEPLKDSDVDAEGAVSRTTSTSQGRLAV